MGGRAPAIISMLGGISNSSISSVGFNVLVFRRVGFSVLGVGVGFNVTDPFFDDPAILFCDPYSSVGVNVGCLDFGVGVGFNVLMNC